ncbi:MAG: ATPase, T2SS/T4P/T4SS family [Candidatus Anstonellales archaeon]
MKQPKKPVRLAKYQVNSEGMPIEITIEDRDEFLPIYEISIPGIAPGTRVILTNQLKSELIKEVKLDIAEILDIRSAAAVRKRFTEAAKELVHKTFKLSEEEEGVLVSYLIQNTLGMGQLEPLLHDEHLEEIGVNGPGEPVKVYHKEFGWCNTNIKFNTDEQIQDMASTIARRIGRQINVLNPLLDAHLPTGERVNASLFPISNRGTTITIRKFSKNPWTLPVLVLNKTINLRLASLIWMAVHNELSLIVAGGTGSGKTSFLNAITSLIPSTQRIITIEDTRELTLPSFLQWIPMVTREPNPEGKGEVTMLDLLVNSLRMRPDRIVVGEIRKQREAEILFEAMHTGHSVYSTVHADNTREAISRITNPPINIPPEMLSSVSGIVVQFRHRRMNIRRTIEFAEITSTNEAVITHAWSVKDDKIKELAKPMRIYEQLGLYTGMSEKEIDSNIDERVAMLEWMIKNNYLGVDEVGRIVNHYYKNPDEVISLVVKDKPFDL